jgi:hypothetical protein
MTVNCPKCDADISDSYEPDDPSVGIVGGWYCDACDLGIGEHEIDREPHEDDVYIGPEPRPDDKRGTPMSKLSGRPGHPGYEEFKRIARSWGYE